MGIINQLLKSNFVQKYMNYSLQDFSMIPTDYSSETWTIYRQYESRITAAERNA
jgi:hypothetical protein